MRFETFTPKGAIAITGAAGFIGSTLTTLVAERFPNHPIIAIDALTYAGSRANLPAFEKGDERLRFVHLDITKTDALCALFRNCGVDTVINLAAETHVDRSLSHPEIFFQSNLMGALAVLEAARQCGLRRIVHISTDEVYGPTPAGVEFAESAALRPSSPYAASKAAADLAILSYVRSYGVPAIILRATNNYGPRQFPEKIIPYFVSRALAGLSLPLYGDGEQERDWIHVEDFSRAILCALRNGQLGEIYNVPGDNRRPNKAIAEAIISTVESAGVKAEFVTDRPGHDQRYRIAGAKIRALGFNPTVDFETGLCDTIKWYMNNPSRLALDPNWDRTLSLSHARNIVTD